MFPAHANEAGKSRNSMQGGPVRREAVSFVDRPAGCSRTVREIFVGREAGQFFSRCCSSLPSPGAGVSHSAPDPAQVHTPGQEI